MIEVEAIFDSFVTALDQTIDALGQRGKDLKALSEDTICFFLAAGFLQHGVSARSIQMEVRHPVLSPESETAVDVHVDHPDGPTWIEVKFDKRASRTHFGNLLNDICRLALIQGGKRLMLYVAGEIAQHSQDLDPRFLRTDRFCLDTEFFEKLHKDVRKRLNERVAKKLKGTTTVVRLLAQRVDRPPACLLYEISTQP